jgi:hypothetical protein
MGAPMDIDRQRGGRIGGFECYNCHENGHLARNCPHPPTRPRRNLIRGVFSNLNREEQAEVLKELQGFTNDSE